MKTSQHPVLPFVLSFDPVNHSYTDNDQNPYLSGTTFVKSFFTPFDIAANVQRVGSRTGQSPAELAAAWTRAGQEAADWGTLVHARAESVIECLPLRPPANARETRAFAMVDDAIAMLRETYDFFGAEQMVFDPLHLLAGTIDLPARNRKTGALAIMDWKNCKKIEDTDYRKRGLHPIEHVNDSKMQHYRLQLSLYGWLMIENSYVDPGTEVELGLIHLPPEGQGPTWIPMDYAKAEVDAMVAAWWADVASLPGRNAMIRELLGIPQPQPQLEPPSSDDPENLLPF